RMWYSLFLSLLVSVASAAKVAVFLSPFSNSHVIFTMRVAEELARDHDVVIIRPNVNPSASKIVSKHPRVREIRAAGISEDTFGEYKKLEKKLVWAEPSMSDFFAMSKGYQTIFTGVCDDLANDDVIMAKLRAEKFDFALAHHLDLCPVSIIRALEIPGYGFLLSIPLDRTHVSMVGIPMLPSIYPALLADWGNEMNFRQRFYNFLIETMMSSFGGNFMAKPLDGIMRSKFGDEFPGVMDLSKEAKFLIANVHPDIDFPLPVTSKVSFIGGLGMSNESKPLEEPYASFVNSAKKVVFVSFGTVADPKMMPTSWKSAFVELFEKNPDVSFIWRMENNINVPKNVLRNTWHPQNDILAHPKTAAFITHAGYNSLGESIASGTPLITVPLFGDQFRNSRLAEYRGFGIRVEKSSMNYETLNEALHKILDNPSYEKSAQSLRKIVFSSPVKAGDALRHAVNFAIEFPDHNRDLPSLNLFQLYSLDMIALLVTIVVATILFLRSTVFAVAVWLLKRTIGCIYVRVVKEKLA
ncbi:hypothetical protein PMAYCL1PPCAC_04668, partial [Pristionchus mayeri]